MAVSEARFSSNFEDDTVPLDEVETSDPLPSSTTSANDTADAAALVTPTNPTNPFSAVEPEELNGKEVS